MEGVFQYIRDLVDFPIDQVRYLVLFLLSFPLAFILRLVLTPTQVPLYLRHVYTASIGIMFGFLCFSIWEMMILFSFVMTCYGMLIIIPASLIQWYTIVFALSSILIAHIYRTITDYEGWHQDFTGPLMIIVQRVTSLSFALHDGVAREDDDLNSDQKSQKINRIPSVLEYISYNFNFLSFLAGPNYGFKDYIDFMSGDNIKPLSNPNMYARAKEHAHSPSPLVPMAIKFIKAFFFLGLIFPLHHFTVDKVLDPSLSLPVRVVYVYVCTFRVRCRYYFVFILCESICNAGGLGFRGYNKRGDAQWDLVRNVNVYNLEFGENLRAQVQAWNIGTSTWLKRCVYERMTFAPTLMTWVVSALWHGLYPGYHMSFIVFALATVTARKVRQVFWKRYQNPRRVKICYDIVTTVTTCFGRDFVALAFILLTFEKTWLLWSYYYFIPFIICIMLFLFLPDKQNVKKTSTVIQNGAQSKID